MNGSGRVIWIKYFILKISIYFLRLYRHRNYKMFNRNCSINSSNIHRALGSAGKCKDWEVSSEQNSDKSLCPYEERQTINKQINNSVWVQKSIMNIKKEKGIRKRKPEHKLGRYKSCQERPPEVPLQKRNKQSTVRTGRSLVTNVLTVFVLLHHHKCSWLGLL